MKFLSRAILFAMLFVAVMSSCSKEEDKDNEEIVNELLNANFSEKETEVIKSDLESSGLDMVSTMDGLTEEEAVDVMYNLTELLEGMELMSSINQTPVKQITTLKSAEANASHVFRSLQSISEDDPENFTELWDMIVGQYTYDAAVDSFVKTELENEIIIEFPGRSTDNSNTAKIVVNNFGVKELSKPFPGSDEQIDDILTSLNYKLTLDEVVIMEYEFKASFLDDGIPTSISSVLKVGEYVFDVNLSHSPYTKGSYKWSLKHSNEIIVELYAGASGDWSEENIDKNTHEEQYYWGTSEEVDVEEIIQSANSYAQILDVKLVGKVNIKELVDNENELWDKHENGELTEDEVDESMVEVINENVSVVLIDAEKNEKIAGVEAYYPKEYVNTWEYCHGIYDDNWNYIGDTCEVETDTYYDFGFNLVFADSSIVDAEVYFTENFTRVENDFLDMVDELETKYDIDLD